MANTAAHLVDRVLPDVPVRQWVLTLPFRLRARVAFDTGVKAFYEHLLANDKHKLQALVAVMRKLPHAAYGMFRRNQPFDGRLFSPRMEARSG